jgi:membrane protein DedA with SNARE-associated domain
METVGSLTATIALLASQNPFLAYFIIYLATIFLGNISAFVSFWIIAQTNFGLWGFPTLILVIFTSDFSGDLLWYSLGRKLRNTRFGEWVKNHLPGHKKAETVLRYHGRYWIYFSKFVFGSAPPVIFSIGWTGMKFKTFLKNSIFSILLWLPILIGLTYGLVSGLSPLGAINGFKTIEWNFLIGIALFVFLDYIVARGIAKLLRKIIKNGDIEIS